MLSSRMRSSAFSGPAVKAAPVSRSRLVVCAVQDLKGTVVSTSMDKSIVVAVERLSAHPTYQKRIRVTKRYTAHDEANSCQIGDYVRLEGCRPISKTKSFKVAEVIRSSGPN